MSRNPAKAIERKVAKSKEKFAALANSPVNEIMAAFGVDKATDFRDIPANLLHRAFRYLARYAAGEGHMRSRLNAKIESWELQRCRALSKSFALLQDNIKQGLERDRLMCIEDTMYRAAVGEVRRNECYFPPSERAASIILPAFDQRYRPTSTIQPQAVSINISI